MGRTLNEATLEYSFKDWFNLKTYIIMTLI